MSTQDISSFSFPNKIEKAIKGYATACFSGWPEKIPDEKTQQKCVEAAKTIFTKWRLAFDEHYKKENKTAFKVSFQDIALSTTDLKNLLDIFQDAYPDYQVTVRKGNFSKLSENSFSHESGYYPSPLTLNVEVLPTHPLAKPLIPPCTNEAYKEDLQDHIKRLFNEREFRGDVTLQLAKKQLRLHSLIISESLLTFLQGEKTDSFSTETVALLIRWAYFSSSYTLQQEGTIKELLSLYEIGKMANEDLLRTHARKALGAKIQVNNITILEFAEIARKAISLRSEGLNLILAQLLLKINQDKARELLKGISDDERAQISSFISVHLKNSKEVHLSAGEFSQIEDIFKEVHAPDLKRSRTNFF